jgi:hypothetical protein
MHYLHQFSQDGEFEFEFDGIDGALQRRLDEVEICKFHGKECDIHGDDDGVDGDELIHDLSALGTVLHASFDACKVILHAFRKFQETEGFFDVNDGQYAFLDKEADHLDLLDDIVAVDKAHEDILGERVAVRDESEDGGRGMEDDGVGDDHVEGVAENAARISEEMKAGPQNNRLTWGDLAVGLNMDEVREIVIPVTIVHHPIVSSTTATKHISLFGSRSWKNLIKKPRLYGMIPKPAMTRDQKYKPWYLLNVTKMRTMSSMAL